TTISTSTPGFAARSSLDRGLIWLTRPGRKQFLVHGEWSHEAVNCVRVLVMPLRSKPHLPLAALCVQFPDARWGKAEMPLGDSLDLTRFEDQKGFRLSPLGEGKQGTVDGGFFG